MSLLEYLLPAVGSIFWPLLLTVVLVALRTPRPVPLLAAFLAGGLLTCVAVGLVLVFTLDSSHLLGHHHHRTLDPAADLVIGALALVSAVAVRRVRLRRRRPSGGSRRWSPERLVESTRLAFAAGVVLDLLPGFFPLIALRNIAEAGYAASVDIVLVVVFYVIMFASVELPIVGYLFAPQWTVATVQRFNDWLDRNAGRVAADVLGLGGACLIVRGLVALA